MKKWYTPSIEVLNMQATKQYTDGIVKDGWSITDDDTNEVIAHMMGPDNSGS